MIFKQFFYSSDTLDSHKIQSGKSISQYKGQSLEMLYFIIRAAKLVGVL